MFRTAAWTWTRQRAACSTSRPSPGPGPTSAPARVRYFVFGGGGGVVRLLWCGDLRIAITTVCAGRDFNSYLLSPDSGLWPNQTVGITVPDNRSGPDIWLDKRKGRIYGRMGAYMGGKKTICLCKNLIFVTLCRIRIRWINSDLRTPKRKENCQIFDLSKIPYYMVKVK